MKRQSRGLVWQESYGAFGVSESQRETVMRYIASQHEHHSKWSYEQEFTTLVRKTELEVDPEYLFG